MRSSRTCQHGDWMRRVRRVQAVPGQAGWLPAHRHLNHSLSEITHCWMARGDQGYVSRLASVQDVVPAMPSASVFAGRTRVLQPVQDRIVLEMSWSEKQRMMYLFLGCGEERLQSFAVLRRKG